MATRRIKRGHYLTTCELLCASPAATAEGKITRLFMQKLETSIREKPADWLWSHRRWKHQRASIPHTAET
jgi:KDO2-lipid IV(A) lauroyltransferase